MRRTICGVLTALAVAFGTAPLASATATATAPAVVQQVPDDDGDGVRDNDGTGDNDDNGGDNGWWGLLGLLGLLGLGGLFRRGPKRGAMKDYPAARAEEPPANAYPPATPRRNPPG